MGAGMRVVGAPRLQGGCGGTRDRLPSGATMAGRYDLVIVGMGSAGMVAAEFAPTLGVRVAAVERDRVGGDCLWTGCVPSKALLASAKAAHTVRHAAHYGLEPVTPRIDTARVWARLRAVQADLAATTDSPEHFRAAGVDLHFGSARLEGPGAVAVDGAVLAARHVLVATGGRPAVPAIAGLTEAGFQTSETVFALPRAPESLIVIGGGPISVELAQAFCRLGVTTTVLQRADRILPRDEPDLVRRLVDRLRAEGVDLRLGVDVRRVSVEGGVKVVHGIADGRPRTWRAAELLVGAGRRPNVEGLGLAEAGVDVGPEGVVVDGGQRTSAKPVFAAGDVVGGHLFTHAAGFAAARAVRNMFFPGVARGGYAVPWCTFTDPELAHAGLTEAQARERFGDGDVRVWRHELRESDRARAEGATEGVMTIVTRKRRIVGAHVLAPQAGELIGELALAIHRKLRLTDLANVVHVYPTLALGIQQLAAQASYASARRLRWLVR